MMRLKRMRYGLLAAVLASAAANAQLLREPTRGEAVERHLPGDRTFQDYAFPPDLGYPSFARENLNRPIDRQPLNPPSDMGGYPQRFPLY